MNHNYGMLQLVRRSKEMQMLCSFVVYSMELLAYSLPFNLGTWNAWFSNDCISSFNYLVQAR